MSDRRLQQLFRRFQERGDVAALGRVFDEAAPELLHVALFLCPDRATAEDVLQATFQTAIEKREAFDARQPLVPWLLGILTRHARQTRSGAARRVDPERLAPRDPPDPAEVASQREVRALVERELAALPETYSGALRSHLEQGQSAREIALALGISANAASVRLHRGLKLLRRALPKSVALAPAAVIGNAALTRHGLARVRSAVLAHASESTLAASSIAATATITSVGGLTMMKIATVSGAVLIAVGATFWTTRNHDRAEIGRLQAEVTDLHAALARAKAPAPARETTPTGVVAPRATAEREPTPAPESQPQAATIPTAQQWLARFLAAKTWREALDIARDLARLAPADSLAILREIYAQIPQASHRSQVLKPFADLANAVDVLHLGAIDPEVEVQAAAFEYLRDLTFQDFSLDREAYLAWYRQYGDRPLAEVLRANAGDFVHRLSILTGAELAAAVEAMERLDMRTGAGVGVDMKQVLRDAGLYEVVERWIVPGGDPKLASTALRWLAELGATEGQLRRTVLPVIEAPELYGPETVSQAWDALGQKGNVWAVDPILGAMQKIPVSDGAYYSAASALADIGDPSVIPTLIGMIVAEDGYSTRYGVGYFGLGPLTGVDYSETHDAAFWLEWWEKNKAFLPPAVQAMSIPSITLQR